MRARWAAESGQATAELAMVFPVVLLLALMLVQAALVLRDDLVLVDAAREAARSPALGALLAVLAGSERSGTAAGPALSRLSAAIRARARRRAMARARRVPVRLLFPLVFLVLPAFLVLTVAPVVLASLR